MAKKNISTISCVILIAGLSLCLIVWHLRTNEIRHTASLFSVRIDNDSLFVVGATYFSNPFAIPITYKEPVYDYPDNNDEEFRQARLKNPRCVTILFTEPINAYITQVTLHPDDDITGVGMAEWKFSKGGKTIKLDTGYSWDWIHDVLEKEDETPKYIGESYKYTPISEMVQGRDIVIKNTPFCFKDVDFDGEYEICFRSPGWNRYYYNTYKIVSATKAELMTGHPYNNIVYSDVETCKTEFDYENKTIHLEEVYGSSVSDHTYKRRTVVTDILDPMQHLSGEEFNYSGGVRDEDYFDDGKWVKSIKVYPLDDLDYELEAEYSSKGDRVFTLQSLKYYQIYNEKDKQTLYE